VHVVAELGPPRHLHFLQDVYDRHHDRGEQYDEHGHEEGWREHKREVSAACAHRLLGEELPEHPQITAHQGLPCHLRMERDVAHTGCICCAVEGRMGRYGDCHTGKSKKERSFELHE
jgi:hypothetical protein